MTKIRVIENMKPWEVMKAHEEGKRVAVKNKTITGMWSMMYEELKGNPLWDWAAHDYAVIDDSQSGVDWSLFDWKFFAPYGTYRAGDKELSWEHEQAGSDIIAFRLTGRVL